MGLKNWLNELKRVSQPKDDEEFDKETIEELANMGLVDETDHIEENMCNWEKPTRKIGARLAAQVDEAEAARAAGEKAKASAKPKTRE